ncbi:MAG TPA: RidA family protein [Bryobacteraceae bacterium]|nr:RidA family protein [Bryobacteraceae bacterium]
MLAVVLGCALVCALDMPGASKKVIFPSGAKTAGPYSPGIVAGGFLFVSGQGAKDLDGKFPGDPAAQVRQCLNNVKSIVEAAGLTMQHLVYAQVYVPEPWDYRPVHAVWTEFFPEHGPARAVLGIARLPDNTPVEINAIAVVDSAGRREIRLSASSPLPDAIAAGGLLFVSGVPAATPREALDHMGGILKAAGVDYRHMVFVNPYMTAAVHSEEMNHAYAPYFEFGNTPARATIQVANLDGGVIEFTGVAVQDLAQRRAVRPKNMEPSPTASPCVFAGDIMFCSAKSAFIPGPNSGVYASGVEEQVRMSMRNLLDGLEEGGLKLSDVVAANVYLDDIADFSLMNGVYKTYFPDNPPARTTIQQIAPAKERKANDRGRWPNLEQISFIAVK